MMSLRRLSRILAPARYSAWLAGDLGKELESTLGNELATMPDLKVTRLTRGFLVEANEEPGVLLEAVARAMLKLESDVRDAYPVFHEEMGPLWTGTLQAVFLES